MREVLRRWGDPHPTVVFARHGTAIGPGYGIELLNGDRLSEAQQARPARDLQMPIATALPWRRLARAC
ncbi:UNVERIFIED_ORG: hypothetical protein GGR68_000870 [Xanthomonas campestris]|uniref:hypothetical protein n=1 Tax=Xanthomonas arboricola TaxID=56448 RepID=UPI000CED9CEE|nr:hypothetical protein [Xanthomonas arboricola]PPT52509.1 hypothetical protein XarbCFBP8147_00745 [Xanthomonas arboricola]